ncbi:RQC-minor-1 family DNA-binding protein [Slackia heliotrinireducens]|uniref:RQC-minor-1 family DNA-binding protein n=1 Tax=Slackia heliotrinireducens TaxID=84110 RepID=UPI003315D124
MGRKNRSRVPVYLNSEDANITPEELAIILHGAGTVVHRGGRSLLVKLLKGSRDKKLLELGLDADESYGALSHLTLDAISRKVDWTIEEGFLSYYYDWRNPLLMYTELGWELERPQAAFSKFKKFCNDIETGEFRMAERMANMENELQFDVIDLIAQRCDERCFDHLEAWSKLATKRIRKKIAWAQRTISSRKSDGMSDGA